MVARKLPPLLLAGGLTDSVYIVTRYRLVGEQVEAQEKFDVTQAFDLLARQLGWTPPSPDAKGHADG